MNKSLLETKEQVHSGRPRRFTIEESPSSIGERAENLENRFLKN